MKRETTRYLTERFQARYLWQSRWLDLSIQSSDALQSYCVPAFVETDDRMACAWPEWISAYGHGGHRMSLLASALLTARQFMERVAKILFPALRTDSRSGIWSLEKVNAHL